MASQFLDLISRYVQALFLKRKFFSQSSKTFFEEILFFPQNKTTKIINY